MGEAAPLNPRSRGGSGPEGAGPAAPRPVIKWAGGKTQLLAQFEGLYPAPRRIKRYVEPFVGSAAVFFRVRESLRPPASLLLDSNEDLITLYEAIRDDVERLIGRLREHRSRHSHDHYYAVRSRRPNGRFRTARAARFIYLNKTCYNGLYRVNSRGQFNVPMGRYANPLILDAPNLRAASRALRGVELRVADFREAPAYARRGDFFYFDPPYQPLSKTSSFTGYTNDAFRERDQRDLAKVFADLDRKGCLVMLSNSDTPFVRELYGAYEVRKVSARRAINSRADRRGAISEVVVMNYVPDREGP